MSLKDKILKSEDRPVTRWEDVPEWGVKVGFRVVSGVERSLHERRTLSKMRDGDVVDTSGLRSSLLVATLVDEDESPIFTSADASALDQKNGGVLDRLFKIAQDVNGFTDEASDELEKNSEAAPNGSNGSSSAAS